MKHYINKDALVAEIERRTKAYQENFDKADNKIAKLFADGLIQGLESFLAFLDTFEVKEVKEEPVSNDLEEAACEYDNSHIDDNNLAFKAGAQWQKEQMGKKVDLEKEVHNAADQYDINNNGNIYWEDIVGFAKHFFELGLKAQKGG